jgi:ABC-type lipoprotein release transport system permease subunit
MRLAWHLAHREVRRRPGRTALVVLLVAVTVAGITVADLSYRSRELPAPTDFGGAVARMGVSYFGHDGAFDGSRVDDRTHIMDALREATPVGAQSAAGWEMPGLPVQRADALGLGAEVSLETVDLTSPVMHGAAIVRAGRLPAAADEVAIGSRVADRMQLSVGSTLQLVVPARSFRVVGIADRPSGDPWLFAAPGFPINQLQLDASQAVNYVDRLPPDADINPPFDPTKPYSARFDLRPQGVPAAPMELLILWLLAVLVLAVLGIVVAAAFAASGRRQLVTLGQLGAVGADSSFARRFLALQGAVTSGVGALLGVGLGALVCSMKGEPLLRHGQWNVVAVDLVVIIATAMVSGTLAAIVPTRALTSAPVLTALAGRAPVQQVRPQQVRLGVAGIVVGLVVLGLSVGATRTSGAGTSLATALAIVSAGAVLAGVCAVCPAIVDRWAWLGGQSGGSARLALRSMVRHRARSAALVAAIAAVGAAGVAGASGVERWSQLDRRTVYQPVLDVITVSPPALSSHGVVPPVPDSSTGVDPMVIQTVDAVVPGISWAPARLVADAEGSARVVADDAGLTALGVPSNRWVALRRLPPETVVARSDVYAPADQSVFVPELKAFTVMLVSPTDAATSRWHHVGSMLIGTAPASLTADQRSRLNIATFPDRYSSVFRDVPGNPAPPTVNYEYPFSGPRVTRTEARWLLIVGLLVLITIIVSMGLALWAAEGKVERDQLVALGARPRSLAVMAQVRAWVIATTGGLIAVPLGWGMLQVVLHAADKKSPFPWLTAVMVAVGLPIVVSLGAFLASAAGQRLHPVVGSTMSVD